MMEALLWVNVMVHLMKVEFLNVAVLLEATSAIVVSITTCKVQAYRFEE